MKRYKVCPVCVQLGATCPDCYCFALGFETCEDTERRKLWEAGIYPFSGLRKVKR